MRDIPWFKVDDQLSVHLKAVTAGNRAMGLWVRAGSWCMSQLTDGFLPESMVFALGGSKDDARALSDAGLWHEADGGYRFHDWAEYQPTKDQVLADREAAAERMRRVRANRQPNERGTNGSGSPSPVPVPSPLTSTYVSESQSLDNRAREETDELSSVQKDMAARAGLEVDRLRGKVFDQLGIRLSMVNSLALGNHILAKRSTPPDRPTAYVLSSITRNPAEIEKHIYDAGLA